ncbi:MAG TPA: hypothetical protein VFZ53_30080 [Polyangiaceae bacterium]
MHPRVIYFSENCGNESTEGHMPFALVPILAQVLSASVGDGLEGRYVNEEDEHYLEAENRAFAAVGLSFPWLTLGATYSPSVLLSPLERSERELTVTHTVTGAVRSNQPFYETRRFVAAYDVSGTVIQENSQRELFGTQTAGLGDTPSSDPEPAAPDSGSANQARAEDFTTRRAEAHGDLLFTERLGRTSTLTETAGYRVDSGLDDESRLLYPLIHGPRADVRLIQAVSRRSTLTTKVEGELGFIPSTGGRAWFAEAEQSISHAFSRKTTGDAAAGVMYTRSETPGEAPSGGLGPTALLGLSYNTRAYDGTLTARFEVSYEPTLDRERLVFDPRAGMLGSVDWNNERLHLFALTSGTLSASPDDEGSLNGISGSTGADYSFGAGFYGHTGLRAAWQSFEGAEVVPETWVYYIGISWFAELLEPNGDVGIVTRR